ncbi:hypothetical protein [Cellulomonas sp. A375-1]|uniref:hypothetical protein n=1 Tax=Cellulomonas sp. A375-1 TaxID=1672219 RepID=UPI00069F041D|nr:hypothetical protein [Cellulomonas sp. A375-1]
MDVKIDLDLAAAQISDRGAEWQARGLRVGPITWRDQARTWPNQVVAGRAQAAEPDSVGVKVTCGGEEGELVLYAGGWADVLYWGGDGASEVVDEMVGDYDSPLTQEDFARVLEAFGGRFRGVGGGLPK